MINFAPQFLRRLPVNYLDQFVIPFSGLKTGIFTYDFDIDDEFFEHFERSEIRQAKVSVDVEMERQQRMLVFRFHIEGTVVVPCDRCLNEFDQPISGSERLIVKFGDEHGEETEDIFIITENEHSFDLGPFIYEYINLLVPFRRIHGMDEKGKSLCDPEVTKFIRDEKEESTDPRWDALKTLKNKGEN
jgi:uncharacterized metal-binding protein YceD (DUF177 family)